MSPPSHSGRGGGIPITLMIIDILLLGWALNTHSVQWLCGDTTLVNGYFFLWGGAEGSDNKHSSSGIGRNHARGGGGALTSKEKVLTFELTRKKVKRSLRSSLQEIV